MDYPETKPSELRVGDIISAQFNLEGRETRLFTNVTVTSIDSSTVWADMLHFYTDCNTFYLIKPAKKPLPKSIGSVVEVDGVKYVRVTEDSEWYYEWAKSLEGYALESVSSEYLADLDYTVV